DYYCQVFDGSAFIF
nr:immunoglobulin light chain junction region [Macaca mulatta]MOV98476.1 immunoglobulin light chain junction region [Macaca mulatta]MOW01971.1 immunoglobulin light chain junction region [Macaca mulatta]